ncbi:toprim domain-containing protein [Paenibacillus yanchengensis]|uniref:Toprim domain-containing protein n=1 Tax=Paenibacillus yanchengensis TaxID=2035833 RepID=A0ABW4YQJ5_9BACL
MDNVIIVEGKNDRSKLRKLLHTDIDILCTYGTPGEDQLALLRKQAANKHVYIFTDNDASGKRIRGMLRDLFPDAVHLYTRRGYPGVEKTPLDYLVIQLEKAELNEYINYEALLLD